jgi:hypothetical protein
MVIETKARSRARKGAIAVRSLYRVSGVTAVFVSMVALAACGGGSGTASFAASANAICSHESAAEVNATRTPAQTLAVAQQQVGALVAARQSALMKLRKLSPPHQDQAAYRAFLQEWPAVEEVWQAGTAKITKGYAAYDVNGAQSTEETAADSASKAGLAVCGETIPAAERNTLTAFIQQSQTNPTPSVCTQHTSSRFLAVSGGMSACIQSLTGHSADVQISDLRGTTSLASALVARSGGNQQSANFVLFFVNENGRWQLDDYQ